VDSVDVLEELERLQAEFGRGQLMIPDPIEQGYRNPVDRIEFDAETQTYLLVSDH
jgi:hypothetical protein